jgi:hypothetical protein
MKQCSRRIFLKGGLGACSTSALIPPLSARPVIPCYKAEFDKRFEEARAFTAQVTARATPSSDPSDLVLWIIAPSARASTKEIAIA